MIMSLVTIADLRHRAWVLANTSIDTVNSLNNVIFEDSSHKPARVDNKPEDMTNISLLYVQDGIDIFNNYISEIVKKRDYLISIQNKHLECQNVLTQILE